MGKIAFIINPVSGTHNKNNIRKIIENEIDAKLFKPIFAFTEHHGHATEIAKNFVENDVKFVVAVGGDGTVNETARALVHTDAALGIVPVGSGDGFARHLGISRNVKKAVRQLNNAAVIEVDYGLKNEKPFFCTCGAGFDAHISMEFAKSSRRGFVNYIRKSIGCYFSYKPENYTLLGQDIEINSDAFLVTFANASQWGNNAYIAPKASITDGLLDIALMSKFPLSAAPALALQLFTKKLDKNLYINIIQSKEITLLREKEGAFHCDGEPCEESKKINIKIVEKGLKVLAQSSFF
jgi:YegS/Rv2252/BmrU family lipid kinase